MAVDEQMLKNSLLVSVIWEEKILLLLQNLGES